MTTAKGPAKDSKEKSKPVSRVALINLSDDVAKVLSECFRQFNVDSVMVGGLASTRLWKEKYEGCVTHLNEESEAVLKGIRTSPSNTHSLIYGITPDTRTAIKYSKFGVNALFFEPVEKSSALRVVRATNLLLMHEYRRYVRIPVAVEALLEADGVKHSALTVEVSSGGMCISSTNQFLDSRDIRVTVQLPESKKDSIRRKVCWRREADKTIGIKFEPDEPG